MLQDQDGLQARFRVNIVVSGDGLPAHAEYAWQKVTIGDVSFKVSRATACFIPTPSLHSFFFSPSPPARRIQPHSSPVFSYYYYYYFCFFAAAKLGVRTVQNCQHRPRHVGLVLQTAVRAVAEQVAGQAAVGHLPGARRRRLVHAAGGPAGRRRATRGAALKTRRRARTTVSVDCKCH